MNAVWLFACVYIDRGDPATPECVDQDSDGASIVPVDACPSEFDCDDQDPERTPGNDEVAYDRIDQDGDPDRADLVDVDGDGFPGISWSDWEDHARVRRPRWVAN